MSLVTLVGEPWADHALLDSGDGRKLERYGPHRLIRPEPMALWRPAQSEWRAEGEFTGGSDEDGGGRWMLAPGLPPRWEGGWEGVRFHVQPTPFRHLAFFPDMAPHWAFARARLGEGDEFLNLFGYTGVMSLVAARAGARVTHVDASRKAVEAARANAALAGLAERPLRWLVEDAGKFAAREVRRGRRYQGVVLDPPKFGRGPDGETWRLEDGLAPLVADCARLVADDGFLIVTTYAVRLSAWSLDALVAQAFAGRGGVVSAGEMTLREEARGLLMPTAIFARWEGSGA